MPSAAKQAAWKKSNTAVSRCAEPKHSRAVCFTHRTVTYQYLGEGAHWLLVFGNDADVEDGGKDEDEAWSRGGTWEQTTATLTDNSVYKAAGRWWFSIGISCTYINCSPKKKKKTKWVFTTLSEVFILKVKMNSLMKNVYSTILRKYLYYIAISSSNRKLWRFFVF